MRQDLREETKSPSEYWGILKRRQTQQNFEDEPISLLEYWEILKRRQLWFWLPAVGVAFAAAYLAFSPPSIYRSEATILIEDQELPADIIGTTITSYATQQIQLISQRLLTVKNIKKVVEKFEIYGPMDPENPIRPTALAGRFRRAMELELVSTDVIDARGRSTEAAIAFTLAFNSPDPDISQKVAQELVSLFLSENQRSGALRTTGVSAFLRAAVNNANEELLQSEVELADFKAKHEGALPELHQLNLNIINRTERQFSDVNLRIQQLEQRKLQLSAQLSALSPSAPVTLPSGETIMSDRERLRALLVDFRRKTAIYEAGHPDLLRLEREIETLRRTVGDPQSYELIQEQLRQERERLAILRDRYSENHPDIKYSEAAIAELESQLAATDPRSAPQLELANNPAYVLINTQLQSTELEIQNLLQKRRELQAIIAEHEALIRQAPHVERQYLSLMRSYDNSKAKYRDLQAKLRAADVAADVEQEFTGQRFTLLEPPVLPLSPSGPNRLAIVVMGFLLAAGVGVGCMAFVEFIDDSIRSAAKLASIAGAPPLAVIPYLNNSADIAQARTRRNYFISALFVSCVLGIVLVHYFVRPLYEFLQ